MTFRIRWCAPALILATLLMVAGAALSAQRVGRALSTRTVAGSSLDPEETAFLGLINAYRNQNGLSPLGTATNLNRAAAWLAESMAVNSYFSHTDSSGRGPSQRAMDC